MAASAAESFVSGGIFGETTKALRQSWNQRVVDIDQDIIAEESNIRQLFHDLKLFPSKSQGLQDILMTEIFEKRKSLAFLFILLFIKLGFLI